MTRPAAHPSAAASRRAPNITRLFTAMFVLVALVGLIDRIIAWETARQTQTAMIDLSQRLAALPTPSATPGFQTQINLMQELAAEAADDVIQATIETTVIFGALLIMLGLGFWYNRRRLAAPFGRVVTALERITAGSYGERLLEDQPDEFGTIARGVNAMAAALTWREQMQDYAAQLLSALNAPQGESGGLLPALRVLAVATGATGVALYQPDYDANSWAPTVTRGLTALPVSRALLREVVGDARDVQCHDAGAAAALRERLRLTPAPAAGDALTLAPLHAGERLVGILVLTSVAALTPDHRSALELARSNLAIACEREAAYHRTRRLATDIRRTAQHLEEQSDELQRVNAELDRANQLKSSFLANMSHELRTPLTSVIGFSEMLLTEDTGPLTPMQRDFLETVARNGRHLLQLISELLDLSKIESGRLTLQVEPLDLRELFAEAAASVRAQVERRGHRLEVEATGRARSGPEGGSALAVRADRVRVRQVLLNLLSNAIKFTPNGGRISLSGRSDDGGREVRVEVRDNGIGIAPEDQTKLFTEFTQLDASASRQYEGTGLGLALSRRLIELHGGLMGVQSAPGQGSTFWFTLPAERAE
jgi:signal transduction histidine kinase